MTAPAASVIQPNGFDEGASDCATGDDVLGSGRGGKRNKRLRPLQSAAAVYVAVQRVGRRNDGVKVRFVGNMDA